MSNPINNYPESRTKQNRTFCLNIIIQIYLILIKLSTNIIRKPAKSNPRITVFERKIDVQQESSNIAYHSEQITKSKRKMNPIPCIFSHVMDDFIKANSC